MYAGIASECAPWAFTEAGAAAFGTRASCNMSNVNRVSYGAIMAY